MEPSIQTLARLARALNVSEASLLGDQRATLEGFFDVLSSRGVRIESAEQGVRLANAVADMVNALGGMGSFVGEVDVTQDGDDPGRVGPGRHVGRSRIEHPRRRLLTFRPARPLEHHHRMDVTHRRRDGRRPRGPPRCSRIVRRVLPRVVASHRAPAVQGNISRSTAGSLRAMHFHRQQWDYWFVVAGRDVRRAGGSPGRDRRRSARSRRCDCPPRPRKGCSSRPASPTGSCAETDLTLGYLVDRYFDGDGRMGGRLGRSGARDRLARRRSRAVRTGTGAIPSLVGGASGPGPVLPGAGLTSAPRGRNLPPVPARDRAGAG